MDTDFLRVSFHFHSFSVFDCSGGCAVDFRHKYGKMASLPQWSITALLLLSDIIGVSAGAGTGAGQSPVLSSALHDMRSQLATEDDVIVDVLSKIQAWQQDVYRHGQDRDAKKSFVTLTYAQSMDGCVAIIDSDTGDTSSNLPLSGKSSLRLTHGLRSIHDAVLVGGTTFAVDNPRLNVRMWPRSDGSGEVKHVHQPRPVILDTELKSLLRIQRDKAGDIRAQNPIICCARDVHDAMKDRTDFGIISGVDILPCRREAKGRGLDLEDVLLQLRERRDICSVMVEGGASILTAFANKGLAHCVCITIAPKLIGGEIGLNAFRGYKSRGREAVPWCNFDFDGSDCEFVPGIGSDCIFLSRWPRDKAID